MLVYMYQAALYCEECGETTCERLTDEGMAPENPEDEYSYDSDDYPKGPTKEGETDSPSHCAGCGCFLESELTHDGANYVLGEVEFVLRGEQCGEALVKWVNHYEGRDDRVKLSALADDGLTLAEIVESIRGREERLTRAEAERDAALAEQAKLVAEVASLRARLTAPKPRRSRKTSSRP